MDDNTLSYWQSNRAAAYLMARGFIEDGDYFAAVQWQEYAAYCHRCYWNNYVKYY